MFLSPRLFLRKKSPFLLVIYIIPLYDFPRLCDVCHESNTFFIFQAQTHNGSWARAFYYTACCVQYHIYPLLWLASTTPSFYLQFPNFRWHWIRFSTWTSLMSIPFSFTGFTDTVVLVVCVTFHRFKKWCHEILYWNSRARGLPLLCIMFWESFRESCLEGLIFSFCFTV
jgi:hypothetical protein